MSEQLEPLATEAGQQAIVRAINNLSSLEYAVRAEHAATAAAQSADDALTSATNASNSETKARDWAEKTNGAVETETIVTPPETEGDPPTEELVSYFSAKYWAQMAEDYFGQMTFDTVPTEDSTNGITSGAVYDALATKQDTLTFDNAPTQNSVNPVKSGGVYSALDTKADKSTTYTKTEVDTQISTAVSNLVNSAPSTLDTLEELADALGDDPNFTTTIATQLGNKADKSNTYTKTEVDTALSNVQSTLTFDNVPTANSDNPVKSSGIKTALDGKQNTLTFDSTPTANSTNPVTSGGVYTALQNVDANIEVDDEITEDSDNPVTSAAIYEALQNIEVTGGAGNESGIQSETLYKNDSGINGVNSTITLSKSWKEFDLILIISALASESPTSNKPNVKSHFYFVNKIKQNQELGYGGDVGSRYFSLQFTTDTSLVFTYSNNERIYEVIGIKFSKNLSEQMYSNVLYENNTGTTRDSNITLSDSYKNYDFFTFDVAIVAESPTSNSPIINPIVMTKEQLEYSKVGRFSVSGWGQRSTHFIIVDDTTFRCKLTENDQRVYRIIGYKMAKGGYSGIVSDARMTVKSGTAIFPAMSSNQSYSQQVVFDSPMPDANYNVLVCKGIGKPYDTQYFEQVDNTSKTANGFTITGWCGHDIEAGLGINWIAIRPNSYTREGMVEDILFSNTSGVYSGDISLSGNISDYDLILFYSSPTGNMGNYKISNIFTPDYISQQTDGTTLGNAILLNEYDNRYVRLQYINDTTLHIIDVSTSKLLQVIGIKFGRYVSGVAVDTTVTSGSSNVVTSGAVYTALQNAGGGGSSVTVDSSITQNSTNPVESAAIYTALAGKQDTLTIDSSPTQNSTNAVQSGGVYTALANKGDVTTNTNQNITGTKTFVGSKKVGFKQSTANDKLGFTLYGNTGTERGYLEFNPTNTIDGVTGLMTLGNYATSAASLTQVGFRRYSNISGASGAYNLLMPMVADARTPFSLTTTYQDFYLPLGFTDGTTTVKTAKSGVVDLSPLLASLEARIAALEGN